MLSGFSGSLVSEYFAETLLQEMFAGALGETSRESARTLFMKWSRGPARRMGPVTGARGVHDLAAVPLLRALGFETAVAASPADGGFVLSRLGEASSAPVLLAAPWAEPLDRVWGLAARAVVATGASWCLSTNGRQLRLLDVCRAVARGFVEFELEAAADDDRSFAVLWGLLRRDSFECPPLVERVALASSRHTVGVCRSLRFGVLEAIGELLSGFAAGRMPPEQHEAAWLDGLHEQALTVVYRILFLLFAEARGLVPVWHPSTARPTPSRRFATWPSGPAGREASGRRCRPSPGSRTRDAGWGRSRVTPFNGRLFAPAGTPLAESGRQRRCDAACAIGAVGRDRRDGVGGVRIAYRDLGVEQLGAVYERVLDYRPRL